ncbi:aminotransferase class IV [Oharaeibacter diazotrophicus]|uniref:Probable branched-chain-amino-acid aminotransferase n=1 Tax=Oharaeibacter diazotrophicus TaxID=1920512 RepID=A0A4R6RGC3_9HYPH|nr:aminotransferase class IV [Oharaeibacter diazotrophicus]TDP85312.1 branched-chain amino acid aminotransferase [Oharaeibacter diazotrophicus]BBE74283.1 branched-chain-amino-acid aminotransferase [Pleomorphomonas sp. SM30]GLS76027.1 aminotransferase class IV [Oharaeibacter diazotrophicus]
MQDASTKVSTHDSAEDPRNAAVLIHVDGKLYPREEAKVSVYDSGFMMGDGIWEGLRLYEGHVAFLADHLDRLYEAAKAIDLDIGMTPAALEAVLYDTLAANGMTDGVHIRLMVTRGKKKNPFQDPRLSVYGPTIVIIPEYKVASEATVERGLSLFTVHVHRQTPDSQDPKLNSHSKLNCILALIQALKAGGDEALMLDPHGFVNTCNSTNFFIVRKGEVWTSSGDHCMNGITRRKVIEACRGAGIPVFERNYSLVDTYGADEAFVTGTFGAQTPVVSIDGRTIGDGRPGPMFRRIRGLYKDLVVRDRAAAAERAAARG